MTRIFSWDAGIDGCSYYRIWMPAKALRDRGHNVVHHSSWLNEYPGRGNGWFTPDTLVGQRVCEEPPSRMWRSRTDIKRRVYEFDDDFFNVPPSNPAYQLYSQPSIQDQIRRNIASADVVTCTTETLAETARSCGATDVRVIPNTIPSALIDSPRAEPRERAIVGWAGSGTHDMDWQYEQGIERALSKLQDTVEVHTIGARYPAADRHTPWEKSVPKYWESIDFDIGLAPLRPHAFNRAKSPVKALEYAARGVVIVASNFGPYTGFVQHGVTGFLVNADHEWLKYIRALVADPDLRANMAANARALARRYTIEAYVDQWEKALCLDS